MAPKRAHPNKGQHKPDPTPQKRVRLQNTPQNTHQYPHENFQRTSTRIERAAAIKSQQAASQVFETSELLEQILLNVGNFDDLIRMRGVCHKWQDVIQDNKSLQQIIFLSPQKFDHIWRSMVKVGPGSAHYALAKEPKESLDPAEEGQYHILKPARINPLLFRQLIDYANMPVWNTGRYDRWTSEELHLRQGARVKGTKIKVSSPLLNMFATQPPLCEMTFRTGGDPERQIRNRKGIKVIDVLRVAEGLVGGWEGRAVIDEVIFPQGDGDVIYRQSRLDPFYWWNNAR